METFGVATVVQPSLLDSSAASASVVAAFLASTRTTKTSTLATSENGNGMSVRRTVSRPVPVPEESLHAASATVAITKAANSRMVLLISHLLQECVNDPGVGARVQSAAPFA